MTLVRQATRQRLADVWWNRKGRKAKLLFWKMLCGSCALMTRTVWPAARRLGEGRDARSWKSWHVSLRRVAVRQLPQRRTEGGWLPKLIKGGVSSTWTIDRLYELRRSIKPRFNLRRKCWSIIQRQRLFFFFLTPPSTDLITATTWLNVTLASTRITFPEWKRVTFTMYFTG